MSNLRKEYDEMAIPKQLTAEHQALLKEAADSMAKACLDRAIALDKTQQYLDDPKPSLLSESNVMAQGGREAMLNAMMKVMLVEEALSQKE
ncbi:MAG: hypothetical protein GX796_11205 [Clostridiaceae bacterium]|nr:hypothetical protein [Clostridiaceae bacterium]